MILMAELVDGVKCKVVDWYVVSEKVLIEVEHPDGTFSIVKCNLSDCKRLYWKNGDTIYENRTA